MGISDGNDFPFENGLIKSEHAIKHGLRKVRGITVNKVHGNEKSIKQVQSRLSPDIESMEGAAFFYACKMSKVNFIQIRAISNYVEKRNKNSWQIELALSNLASELKQILNQI